MSSAVSASAELLATPARAACLPRRPRQEEEVVVPAPALVGECEAPPALPEPFPATLCLIDAARAWRVLPMRGSKPRSNVCLISLALSRAHSSLSLSGEPNV